ncbi:hypothetical protein ACLK1T_12260 [Escherichia coli]
MKPTLESRSIQELYVAGG